LNPDEGVWNGVKNNSIGRKAITSPERLKREAIGDLRFIQKSPDRVRAYRQTETTQYAAQSTLLSDGQHNAITNQPMPGKLCKAIQ
jgi:hypothetical protein